MTTAHEQLRGAMGSLLGVPAGHVSLFWRGRVALYAILRALGVGRGDEVILPAFTCVAVPNAILYAGATPVYVDIEDATLTIDPAAVAAAVGERTRAVLAQNTFGLSADVDAVAAAARPCGAAIVDDCTHGLGGTYKGRGNGAAADAAFFSTQWSKPISTGLGGLAVTTRPELARRLAELERSARAPRALDRALLGAMVLARERVATPRVLRAGRAVYRSAGRAGLVPGSSTAAELASPAMPEGFLARMAPLQAELAVRRLPSLAAKVRRRREAAQRYSAWLAAHGRTAVHEPECAAHAFLRYPLRVRDRDAFLADAQRRGVLLGDWFSSPLYPIASGLEAWGYRPGQCPVAERVASQIVNLPTDLAPGSREAGAVEALLEDSIERVLAWPRPRSIVVT